MLRGRKEPRVFTPPLRELTDETSLGFEVIDFAENVLGIDLVPWQKWLLVHALEITGSFEGEWHFRFRTVLCLISRQQGKTFLSKVLSTYFLYVLEVPLVIGTAQDLEQAEDTWSACVEMVKEIPELNAEVEHVWYTNGAKRLQLTGNRSYQTKASSRKAGRGKSGDLLLLDELREHRDWEAWSALTKTTMARPNALVWCMSNAGDAQSVVLRHLRTQAHLRLGDPDGFAADLAPALTLGEDVDDSLGLFEYSAPADADQNDRTAWEMANPSLGYGFVTERALESAFATDPPDVFRTECLCQWVTTTIQPPFPDDAWNLGKDETSEIAPDSELFWGVDVASDRAHSAIAVCGMRSDRLLHVELVEYRPGVGWVKDWFVQRAGARKFRVAIQGRGATASGLVDVLAAIDGVEVIECVGRDVAGWSGRLWDAVAASVQDKPTSQPIRHRTQPALDLAAAVAVTRPLGDGAWAWDRNKSSSDICPLVAVNMAYGLATNIEKPEEVKVSAYEDHDLLIL